MNEIDLHQIRHAEVEVMVEDYVLLNTLPIRIITGNSEQMKEIVIEVLNKHEFEYVVGDFSKVNMGYITVEK